MSDIELKDYVDIMSAIETTHDLKDSGKTLQDKIKEAHPKLSLNTINNYINNWKRIETHLKDQFTKNLESGGEWNGAESSYKVIKEFIMAKPLATRHQYFWSMKTVNSNILNDKLKSWMDSQIESGKKELKDYYAEQTKSKRESENWATVKELQKYNKKQRTVALHTQSKKDLRNWLLTSLYVLDVENHPPMRVDYNMEIKHGLAELDPNKNYLVIVNRSKKEFVFGDYKTVKAYGVKRVPLSKKMNAMINIYLKHHPDNKYLIQDRWGENITKDALQKSIVRAFKGTGKNIGVSMLRHILISEKVDTGDKLKDKSDVAEKMGHSVATQEIYKKFE